MTKHYYANGQRIASRVNNDLYYLLGDHLGSTTVVADDQGNELGYVVYDAYGEILNSTLPGGITDRLFTGQRYDDTIGLYDYNARFYDPLIGQFTQPDSVIPNPMDPRAWNRFGYVYGSPVNYTDPSGYHPIIPFLGDFLDVAGFGKSAYDFYNNPTWANAGWLTLDTIGLLPLIPAVGMVRHAGKLDPRVLRFSPGLEAGLGIVERHEPNLGRLVREGHLPVVFDLPSPIGMAGGRSGPGGIGIYYDSKYPASTAEVLVEEIVHSFQKGLTGLEAERQARGVAAEFIENFNLTGQLRPNVSIPAKDFSPKNIGHLSALLWDMGYKGGYQSGITDAGYLFGKFDLGEFLNVANYSPHLFPDRWKFP